jgi:hypothetical protein
MNAMSSNPNCPTCGGRGAVANTQTGSPEACPNCQNYLTGTAGLDYRYLFSANPANPVPLVLAANATKVGAQVAIGNDSDFVCDRFIASSTGLFSVYLTDDFSSRPLTPNQNVPINGENISGTAQLPYWLPKPWLIKRTSTVTASFNDRSGAGNTIQFLLAGYKVT